MRTFIFTLLALSACSQSVQRLEPEGAVPEVEGLALERMYAVRVGAEAVLGGFDGAAKANTELLVLGADDKELARTTTDENGRFRVAVADPGEALALRRPDDDEAYVFRVRTAEKALEEAVGPSLGGAGGVPNDLSACSLSGIIVRSADNAVSGFSLSEGLTENSHGIRLPPISSANGELEANPWFATPLDDSCERVAVTAFSQRRIYIIDLPDGTIEHTLTMDIQVTLDQPFSLPAPHDLNGDGTPESEVVTFVPSTPQPVMVSGRSLLVGFTSYFYRPDTPIFLPGVLAVWNLDELSTAPKVVVLPSANPQEIQPHAAGQVRIVCSGAHHLGSNGWVITTPGGVYFYDLAAGSIVEQVPVYDFAPATSAVAAGSLFVSSTISPAVRRISLANPTETEDFPINDEEVDSIFRLIALPSGLVLAPSFNTDRLYLLDARTRQLSPEPFFGPLITGPGRPIFDGLQVIARRPGRRGVDFTGPDIFALAGIASRIIPIELRKILGP